MTTGVLRRKTACQDLTADLIRRIELGDLRPGDAIPAATGLAETYKVAYVTAHKAVQQLARDGYCVRKTGKGSFVSDRPLRISSVGIPAYYQANPFLAHMVEELTLESALRRIHAVVGRAQHTRSFVDRLVENGVKSMIRFPGCSGPDDLDEVEIWRLLQERNISTVAVNDFWRDGGPFPHVCVDEAAGISEMMDHLIGLGHRRILLVMEMLEGARPRAVEAHRRAFARHGLPYDPRWMTALFPPWFEAKPTVLPRMMEESTAAIVIYDLYAVELAEAFRKSGVVLGRDYSLAGFDGIPEAAAYGLSTVVQPMRELVTTAFDLLQRRNAREAPKVMLKPACLFRSSTGPAPDRNWV